MSEWSLKVNVILQRIRFSKVVFITKRIEEYRHERLRLGVALGVRWGEVRLGSQVHFDVSAHEA